MPRSKLTDVAVRALQPPGSGQVTHWDSTLPGFGLRLAAGGARTWVVQYRVGGRVRRLSLGRYPLVGLADARTKAKASLASITQGKDPAADKRSEREAPTFDDLTKEYMERHAKPRKRSWRNDEGMIRKHVPKEWLLMKAHAISRRDIRDLLDGIAKQYPTQANRVLALLRKMFNFGVARELVPASPCVGIERPSPERQRDRVLTPDELKQIWTALDAEDLSIAGLFQLYLLTAQRGGELRAMAWTEVDLEAAWWVIPAEKAKNGLAHRVPLSPRAVAVLRELRGRADSSPWVFPSRSARGYRKTLTKPLERIRTASGVSFQPHDLRRTVATYLTSELGVSRLVVSKILNHVETGVTKVYDRASYDREKTAALVAWDVRLDAIVRGEPSTAKVIPLRAHGGS